MLHLLFKTVVRLQKQCKLFLLCLFFINKSIKKSTTDIVDKNFFFFTSTYEN